MRKELDILVVGGGTFGTVLASMLVEHGRRVRLWVRREEQAAEINEAHRNERYLPGVELPAGLVATHQLAESIPLAPVVLLVVPSRYFRDVAQEVGNSIEGDQILAHATKGIEIVSFKRMSEILREETCARKIGVLSGPNLARELVAGHPTGALIASRYREVCEAIQALFVGSRLRIYSGSDVIGTEIGGAFKNIIALAAGALDGMEFGDNAKSLLMTRGLSEMARFGVAQGGDVFTFGGLAGIGDLIATCASPLSRNHQVGTRLAQGETLEEILQSMTQVAEGVPTTRAVHEQAQLLGLDLPIVRAVYGVAHQALPTKEALQQLMALPVARELAALRYQ